MLRGVAGVLVHLPAVGQRLQVSGGCDVTPEVVGRAEQRAGVLGRGSAFSVLRLHAQVSVLAAPWWVNFLSLSNIYIYIYIYMYPHV